MWTYVQRTGHLLHGEILIATGYSGASEGKNNPDLQNVPNVGPIPCGLWKICGPPIDTPAHGPYVLHLQPQPETELFGRSGFLMHGDSIEHPGAASEGCIIMDRRTRSMVWQSGDSDLTVIAETNG